MLQYNFTKGKKETLQNWSAFRLSVVKPKLYIEPMGTQNQPNRLKYGKTRAPKSWLYGLSFVSDWFREARVLWTNHWAKESKKCNHG